jgi:hypothetical protein
MPDDPNTPYRTPESPDQDAVNEHRDEGEGPFGSDMTNLLGGTRSPEENTMTPAQGSAYSTGTESESGGSLSPSDARSRFGGNGRDGGDEG